MIDVETLLCFSTTWYAVVLLACFMYFFFAVLSTVFTKESGFLKYSSAFHDNMVFSLAILAVFQRVLSSRIAIPLEFQAIAKHRKWSMLTTCEVSSYVHFFLQLNFLFSLFGVVYSLPLRIASTTPISMLILHEKPKKKKHKQDFFDLRQYLSKFANIANKMAVRVWRRSLRTLVKVLLSKSPRLIQSQAKLIIFFQWAIALLCSLFVACKNVFVFPKTIFLCCFNPLHLGFGIQLYFASLLVANVFAILVIVWLTKNRILRMFVTANRLHINETLRNGFTV